MQEPASRPEKGNSPAETDGLPAPQSERAKRESVLTAREAAQAERERAHNAREERLANRERRAGLLELREEEQGLRELELDQRDVDQSRRETEQDERQRLREMFVGILGHDLRNPLGAITMAADILVRAEDLPERHLQTAQRLKRSATRMARMIDQLLDFARTRLGSGIPIEPREVDMNEVARQVVEELELANPDRVVTLEPAADGRGVWDRDRIVQLLSNLVGNAIQHSEAGTKVAMTLQSNADALEVSIHNDGPPIPADLLPRLFDPFRQGRPETNGIGLGLYIVEQIATAHGGRVDVESTARAGTTFRITLPRRASAAG